MPGTPMTLAEAQKAEVEMLAAVLTSEQIADDFGIGRTTLFYRLMKQDPGIEERHKKGKARAIGAIARSLIARARAGDTTSMIFPLTTGWRETGRIDPSGPDGAPVQIGSAHEHLAAMLEQYAARRAEASILDGHATGPAALSCLGKAVPEARG